MRSSFVSVVGAVALGYVLVGCSGSTTEEPNGATASDLKSCAAGDTVEGIDVAKYQNDVDWAAVKASGRVFGFARVSDGTDHLDGTFATNWQGMADNGIVRGAYQYFRPGQSVADQVAVFVQAVGTMSDDDLPPVLDIETADGQSADQVQAAAADWVQQIEAQTGKRVLVYTAAFMNDTIGASLGSQPLWVANFGADCPKLPDAWSDWQFFQYSEKGTVDGVGGTEVDLDKFNGTLDDLKAFAKSTSIGGAAAAGPDQTAPPGSLGLARQRARAAP